MNVTSLWDFRQLCSLNARRTQMLLIVEFRVPDWAKKFISVESKVEYIALGGCAFEYLSKRPKEPVVEESYSVIDLVV